MTKDFLNYRNLSAGLLSLCFISSGIVLYGIKDGVTTGKFFSLAFIVTLSLLALSIWFLLQKEPLAVRFNKVDVLILLYGFYTYFNASVNNKPFDNITATEFLLLIILYFLCRSSLTLSQPETGHVFYKILIAAFFMQALLQIIYGFAQLIKITPAHNDYAAITGSFFNPGPYAGFLVSLFPFALVIYLYSGIDPFLKKLSLVVCAGIVIILPFTMSRASWLSLIVGLFLILNIRYSVVRLLREYMKSIVRVLVAILVIGSMLYFVYGFKKDSVYGRLFMWKISSHVIRDNFLFGVGFNNYPVSFNKYQAAYFSANGGTAKEVMVAGSGDYAFNELLELISEQGFVGTGIVLVILYSILFCTPWERPKNGNSRDCLLLGARASIAALLVFSLFSYPFSILPIKVNLTFYVAILSGLSFDQAYFSRFIELRGKYMISACCFITGLLIGQSQLKAFHAFKVWKMGSSTEGKNRKATLLTYKKAYPLLKNEGAFLLDYGQSLFKNKQYHDCTVILEEAKSLISEMALYNTLGAAYNEERNYNKAESNLIHATFLMPYKIYPKFALANFYSDRDKKALARVIAKEVVDMKIKIPSESVDMMKREMRLLWEDSAQVIKKI